MTRRLNILDKKNSENVFLYYDLTNTLNIQIERIIQGLERFKGLQTESDKKDLLIARNHLIKTQEKLDKLRKRLNKSQSWYMRK